MSKMNADQIAKLFAQRMPRGGMLTVKQTKWLLDVALTEARQAIKEGAKGTLDNRSAAGSFTNDQGQWINWELYRFPNGAGNFKLTEVPDVTAKLVEEAQNMRAFIDVMKTSGAPQEIWQYAVDRLAILSRAGY